MKVELKDNAGKEQEQAPVEPNEADVLPATPPEEGSSPGGEQPPQEPPAESRERALEIENAELRGRADALKEVAVPGKKDSNSANEAWKATVLQDVNGMADDDFRMKYRCEKYQATSAILEHEFKTSSSQQKQQIAELRAENRLSAKYGKDFFELKSEIDEVVAMAAPEVRQDPDRLSKLMERAYLASSKDRKPAAAKPAGQPNGGDVRRIVSNFEKPTPAPSGGSRKEPETDLLPENYRKLGGAFNLKSEKERKELMESDYVPMNLGGGLVFRDPAKGVEKVGS